ncbi:SGNH/GDSL hydrolase family protein [Xanthobacter pseudotagetidis]|uniref:SGNH/GDSL hydrolase family protein n=1 Tax=Xanthobacter pseudotagetidis TaxID=3119911 RepID=UPI003726B557
MWLSRTRRPRLPPRLPGFLRMLALAALALVGMAPAEPVFAQQGCFLFICPPGVVPQAPRNRRPWFAPGDMFAPQQPAEAPKPAPKKPAEPEGVVYQSADAATQGRKQPQSQFILVMGDRIAGQLAQGLADAYVSDRARVAVIETIADESGYLPTPVDWPPRFPEAVAAARASVAVLAMGNDDLQPIKDGEVMVQPLTDRWMELYAKRVDDVLTALRAVAPRVIVVGLAPVQSTTVSDDYRRLNDILRSRAARAGFPFADVWEGFVDEEGKFAVFGPAVDGQRRRLRLNDGIRFTRAGGRKLAFFVQKDLDRILADPARPSAGMSGGPTERPAALAGPPAGARGTPAAVPVSAPARSLMEGVPPPPVRGRADDFSWPPPAEASQ